MPTYRFILSQHAEEAAFLWRRREQILSEPHVGLADIVWLDGQFAAHLDGLMIGGQAGWESAEEELRWREPGEVFTAACLALECGDNPRVSSVLEVGCSSAALQRGLISAIGWTSGNAWREVLPQLLSSTQPAARRVAIAGYAVRRADPGQCLGRLLSDDNPAVRSRALRAAGELGKIELLPAIRAATDDTNQPCRFWAAWSAARLSARGGSVQTLCDFSLQPGCFQEQAVQMAVRVMEGQAAKAWLRQLQQSPRTARVAALGIGALGDPAMVDDLFPLMQIHETARIAGEALAMITGIDLANERLAQNMPAGFQAGPSEDAADDNVALDPDENLAWPDPALVESWWNKRKSDFPAGVRHLLGRQPTPEWLNDTLRNGRQRQRAAAALELALARPAQPLFEVRARGSRQQELLAAHNS